MAKRSWKRAMQPNGPRSQAEAAAAAAAAWEKMTWNERVHATLSVISVQEHIAFVGIAMNAANRESMAFVVGGNITKTETADWLKAACERLTRAEADMRAEIAKEAEAAKAAGAVEVTHIAKPEATEAAP